MDLQKQLGTYLFDDGYCYISYEDATVLNDTVCFYDAASIENYDHNYQYDGTGNLVNAMYVNDDSKIANVFTAKRSEVLEAVAFCTFDEAVSYTVDVYRNPDAGAPDSGELAATASGALIYSGYYTVPLQTAVQLEAGDTFPVVFKLRK